MKFDEKDFGARIIETITSGLYDGNLNCIREYVQNGIDGKARKIAVLLENNGTDLIIHDDGDGMDKTGLETAVKVGISHKTDEHIGWRGIGFWSGVPISERLVVITKKAGGDKLRIVIDSSKLREQSETNRPATELLTECTGEISPMPLGKDESKQRDHFTTIRLESILPSQKPIFNEKDIIAYLKKNVPAPFDDKKFKCAKEIDKNLEMAGVALPKIEVFYKDLKIHRPPETDDPYIPGVAYEKFTSKAGKLIAVGWFLTINDNTAYPWPKAGIIFKKKGITIGDENLPRKLVDGTYHQWQYGEIHIVTKDLRENAPRNSFEYHTELTDDFYKGVGGFLRQLEMMNRYFSGKSAQKLLSKATKCITAGDPVGATRILDKVKLKTTQRVSYPKASSLRQMKKTMDARIRNDASQEARLRRKIGKLQQGSLSDIEVAKRHLCSVIDGLHPDLRDQVKKKSKKGLLYPVDQITDILIASLKNRTGSSSNEMKVLSKDAFGWEVVNKGQNPPKITISGQFDPSEKGDAKLQAKRNRNFGVAIYSIHDLLVNMPRHHPGHEIFEWFEKTDDVERHYIMSDAYAAIDLLYRVLDKADKYGGKESSK